MSGPIPKRSEELSRARNANRENRPELKKGTAMPVSIPRADKDWHPIAVRMYKSLWQSGQSQYYQQSDWALAWAICEELSEYKKSTRRSAQMAQVIYTKLSDLLITEADRRRIRIELEEPQEESKASVTAIEQYKTQLGIAK